MNMAAGHKLQPHGGREVSGCVLAGLTLLLIVGVVHGTLGFGGYLVNEHRRLVWYEIVVLWLGDTIALFWFLRYVVRWRLGRCKFHSQPLESRKIPGSVWVMTLSMTFGLLAESGMTLMVRHDEFTGFGRAVPGVCTLTQIHDRTPKDLPTHWRLHGEYVDGAGQAHLVTYYLQAPDDLLKLPPAIANGIRRKQPGLQLSIVYDPERTGRSWIPEAGWDDENRLHYLSLLVLFFQFLLTLVFVTLLWESIKKNCLLPWWTELHNVIPLGSAALIMALFGGLELCTWRQFGPW